MNTVSTTKKTADPSPQDWSRFDAMTEAERHAAALSDPDAQPLTPEDFRRMRRTPQVEDHPACARPVAGGLRRAVSHPARHAA